MARRRMSIRTRATLTSVLALVLTAAAAAIAVVATVASQTQGRMLSGSLVPASAAADNLVSRFTAQQILLRQAVNTGNADNLLAVDTAAAAARAAAVRVGGLTRGDPAIAARLGAVTTASRNWQQHVGAPQAAALRQGDAAVAQALQADAAHTAPYTLAVRGTGLALQAQITARVQAVTNTLTRLHDAALGAIIAMIVVSIAAGAEVVTGVWRGMFRPLQRMARAVDAVSGGRYDTRIPEVGPPEIAELSRGVELMRTRLVAALAEQERARENTRRLFDLAPDAIIGVSQSGSIEFANAQAVLVFGYPDSELVGRQAQTLVPEDQREELTERIMRYLTDETVRTQRHEASMTGLRGDGSTFPGELRMSTLPTESEMITVVSIRDVTERAAMEAERERMRLAEERERVQQRLRQSQHMESLGQLVGGVAHDFNNLLGIIAGYTEFAAEQLETFAAEDRRLEPVLEDVEHVQAAAEQAVRLTRQLLTFAKSKGTNREVLELNEVVDTSSQLVRSSLGGGIELVIELGTGL